MCPTEGMASTTSHRHCLGILAPVCCSSLLSRCFWLLLQRVKHEISAASQQVVAWWLFCDCFSRSIVRYRFRSIFSRLCCGTCHGTECCSTLVRMCSPLVRMRSAISRTLVLQCGCLHLCPILVDSLHTSHCNSDRSSSFLMVLFCQYCRCTLLCAGRCLLSAGRGLLTSSFHCIPYLSQMTATHDLNLEIHRNCMCPWHKEEKHWQNFRQFCKAYMLFHSNCCYRST